MVNAEKIYNQTIKELTPLLIALDYEKISKHSRGYSNYKKDPVYFFCHAEKKRFLLTFNFLLKHGLNDKSCYLDLGTFIPVIPLMIKETGAGVEVVDKFSLYGNTLKPIVDLLKRKKIIVYDLDIINDDISNKFPNDYYDFISCEAVIEHLHGSPVNLLTAAKKLLKPRGKIVVAVPNAASLAHRANLLLRGVPPFPPIEGYLASDYPFIGHNREYNLREFKYLLNDAVGFKEMETKALNPLNWTDKNLKWKSKIIYLISLFKKEFMEMLWYAGEK